MMLKEIGPKKVFGIAMIQVEKLNDRKGLSGSQQNPK